MKHHLARPRLHHMLVETTDQVGARSGDALAGEHAERQIKQPIDIERRGHVGLHLGVVTRHRERHGVAGRLRVQRHGIRRGCQPHMHAGRADDAAADLRRVIVKASSQSVANHIDIAERYRHARRQGYLGGRSRAERMRQRNSVDDAGDKAGKIGDADQPS